MLHILWLIIKFILILLGIIAGLIFLVLLLLLFCPVRYRARAEKERAVGIKEIEAFGEVSWLFHGIAVKAFFRNGTPEFEFYILGISFSRIKKLFHRKKKKPHSFTTGESEKKRSRSGNKKQKNKKEESQKPSVRIINETDKPKGISRDSQKDTEPEKNITFDISKSEDDNRTEVQEPYVQKTVQTEKMDENISDSDLENQKENRFISLIFEIAGRIKKAVSGFGTVIRKALGIPSRIFEKIQNIRLTIKKFCGKINWYKEFIDHPRTREAISFVWKDAKKLLHHILPTRLTGKITFGSEDPAITGTVLAVMGMTIPFHKNAIAVNPLFDGENVLEGEVMLKGRIYGVILLKMAAELYFNKNIKYVIHRWRHKEVNHGERE